MRRALKSRSGSRLGATQSDSERLRATQSDSEGPGQIDEPPSLHGPCVCVCVCVCACVCVCGVCMRACAFEGVFAPAAPHRPRA